MNDIRPFSIMKFCGQCGSKNPDMNRYCLNCGAKLFNDYEEFVDEVGAEPAPESDVYVAEEPQPISEPEYQEQIPETSYQEPTTEVQPEQAQNRSRRSAEGYHFRTEREPRNRDGPRKPLMAPLGAVRPSTQWHYEGQQDQKDQLIGIGLSAAAFAVTLVTLLAVSISGAGMNYGSLMSIGLGEYGGMVLMFCIFTIIFAILSLIVPLLNIVTALNMIAAVVTVVTNSTLFPSVESGSMWIIIILSFVVIALGIVSTKFMRRFVKPIANHPTVLMTCLYTWFSLIHRGRLGE